MDRPRILVTTSTGHGTELQRVDALTGRNYSQSVVNAGGLPLMVATLEPGLAGAYLDAVDGVLFTGGVDIHPERFGQQPHRDLGSIDAERDAFEFTLYAEARRRGLPVMGVCRGHQLINVAEGGTLHQHLSAEITPQGHGQKAMRGELHHTVTLEAGSRIAVAFGKDSVMTNSYHHQSVNRLAPTLRGSARTADGLVEAVEGTTGAWLLGVQWHPEMSQAQHPEQLAPFRAFIQAVKEAGLQPA